MAHTKQEQEKFIELRAKGFSFDKIAAEINVSKPTLIKWQMEFGKEIQNLEYFNAQSVLEQYKLTKRQRIEGLAKLLEKVCEEVEKKDLSQTSLRDLLLLKNDCEEKLENEKNKILFHTGQNVGIDLDFESERTLGLD